MIPTVVLFLVMKIVMLAAYRRDGRRLSLPRTFAFVFLWPGMKPSTFEERGPGPLAGTDHLLADGFVRLGLGALLVAVGRAAWIETGSRWLTAALLLPGISLVLHFGVLNVLAGCWRFVGVDAYRLFRAPLLARSLSEFWGRRWNLAFSEMVTVAVYRPVSAKLGRGAGTFAAFVFSALTHELALSVPARGGYGLPSVYFLLQGALVLVEKRTGWTPGRVWTLAALTLPLPLLFNGPCLDAIVWPLVGLGGFPPLTH